MMLERFFKLQEHGTTVRVLLPAPAALREAATA